MTKGRISRPLIYRINFANVFVVSTLVAIAIISLAISAISHVESGDINWWVWADGAFQNFSTEMMGAIATFVLFELFVGRRNEKKNLIFQMGSSDKATAINAVHQLRYKGWVADGSLKNAYLDKANLQGADLSVTILEGASLRKADLQDANLREADLEGADLRDVNLQGATLEGIYLMGADLKGANLKMANFGRWISFSINTTLPDGTSWTPDTDMKRFTDPEHPKFWQPDWAKKNK